MPGVMGASDTAAPSGGGGGGGFLGGIENAVGQGAHDVMSTIASVPLDAVHSALNIPTGLKAMYDHPVGSLEAMGTSMFHDLTTPSIWLHHPYYPAMDILGLLGGGAAAGARIGAVSRVLGGASEIGALTPEARAAGMTPMTPTGQLVHALTFGEKTPQRVIFHYPKGETAASPETFAAAGSYYSRNPAIQAGQKLLDQFHETHPDLRIPGIWRSQAQRINKAQFALQIGEKGMSRIEAETLVRKFGKMSDPEHEAVHMVARGVLPEDQIKFIKHQLEGASGFSKRALTNWLARTELAQKFLDRETFKTEPTMEHGEPTEITTPAEQKTFTGMLPKFLAAHRAEFPDMAGPARSVVLNPDSYDRMVAHASELAQSGDKAMRTSAEKTLAKLQDEGRPAGPVTETQPGVEFEAHPGGTYTTPFIKPEYKNLVAYERQARLVSNLRSHGLRGMGALEKTSEETRLLGPKNLIEGHGLIPNLKDLRRNIRLMENHPHPTEHIQTRLASMRAELSHWEGMRGENDGQISLDFPEEGRPHPLVDPELAKRLFRVPEQPSARMAVDQFMRPYRGGKVAVPPSLTHPYEGIMERHGAGDPNVAKSVASTYQEYARFAYLTKVRARILASARTTPAGIPQDFRMPIVEDYWRGNLGPGWQFPKQVMDEGAHTPAEAEGAARWYDALRQHLTEPGSALRWAQERTTGQIKTEEDLMTHKIPGVLWIDKRLLGGLEKQNPLWSAMESPMVRGVLKGVDALNELQKTMLLYLKPAYILPNMMGNVALALVHQGFLAPRNLIQTFKTLFMGKGLDDETVATIKAVMGAGLTGALRENKTLGGYISRGANTLAGGYGKVIDDPFRFSAFLHEANAAGFKTANDLKVLVSSPELQDELNMIGIRANDALINYERLGPGEQAVLRRLVFFYPWVKGSSRYAYQFVINHPTAASFSTQMGRQGEEIQQRQLGALPSWLEGLIPFGGGRAVSNPASASILGTPANLVEQAMNIFSSHPSSALSVMNQLAPVDAGIYAAISGHGSVPTKATVPWYQRGWNEAFGSQPLEQLISQAVAGFPEQPGRTYPHDSMLTALSKFALFGGATIRPFDKYRANIQAYNEQHPTGYQP